MNERPRAGYSRPQRVIAILLVLAGAATAAPAVAKARKPPKEWDRRVLEYVRFVEEARGLDFEHPIAVEFLSEDDFVARVRAEDDDLTKDDLAEAERVSGQLHALGLIEDDVDLVQAGTDLAASSVVGWYDTETEEMVIRGKMLDDLEVRVTVVHELTHALQDQHFNLDKLAKKARTNGATFAQTALVEGDATRIGQQYIASLPSQEQDEFFANRGEVAEPENALPEGVPAVLEVFSSAPYLFGSSFMFLLDTLGRDEIDQAFEDPPVTEEHIIDPLAWFEEDAPERVKAPKLGPGEKKSGDADAFGAFSLYLTLAARVGTGPAFQAAKGWGGDRYVGFSKEDGRECIRADFKGEKARDTDQIHAALLLWVDELPAGMATVTKSKGIVELTSCETDGVVPPDLDTLDQAAFAILDNRILLTADIVGELDASVREARCAADRTVLDPDLGPIVQRLFVEGLTIDELPGDEQRAFSERFPEHLAECGI